MHPKNYGIPLLCLLLLSNCLPIFSFAQVLSIAQKDGLSNDFVEKIVQDHNGFIWIGTENGLNRYDGYQINVFKDEPLITNSLQGNWISDILEDRHHRLWIGTDKGLNLMNTAAVEFELIDLSDEQSATSTFQVRRITEDIEGNLWVGTNFDGLKRLSPNSSEAGWQITHFRHQPGDSSTLSSNRIAGMLLDSNGYLWVTTDVAVHRMDTKTLTLEMFEPDPSIPIANSQNHVRVLRLDQQGRVILVTPISGIYRIEEPDSKPLTGLHTQFLHDPDDPQALSHKKINDICPWSEHELWIGTNQGLYWSDLTNSATKSAKEDVLQGGKLSSERILRIYKDRQENLWIGTYGGGVNFLANRRSPFQHYTHQSQLATSISHNQVRSMIIDDAGFLWVGTLGGGIDKLRRSADGTWVKELQIQQHLTDSSVLQSNDILQIVKAQSGKLYLAAFGNALIELDPISGQMKTFRQSPDHDFDYGGIWSLCADRHGNIWIGTRNKGVFRLDPHTGQLKSFVTEWTKTVSNKFIYKIYEDRRGHLWFGTESGLYRFQPEKNELREYRHHPTDSTSLSSSWIWTIHEDHEGTIWVGTNQGLNRLDRETGQFRRFYERDGLPSDVVWGILEDEARHIWVSTDAGLARTVSRSDELALVPTKRAFRPYTRRSGLTGDTFLPHAYFKDEHSGQLFFGGLHGFNIIYPDRIRPDTAQPRMLLSTFSVSNPTREPGDRQVDFFIADRKKIELSHLDDILSFTFTDLNFEDFDPNSYEYRLLGLSDQWIPMEDSKTMTFIDLKPGEYSLNVRGLMPDGTLITEEKLLDIVVQPPWWLSWWAYLTYLVLFSGLFYLAYRFQLNRQLEQRESQRLKELDHFKSKLYTNITHEFRTPLTVILGMSEQLENDQSIQKSAHKDGNLMQKIAMIRRNGRNLLQLVNQMLDLSKVENKQLRVNYVQGDIVRYVRYIAESFHSLANSRNVLLRVQSSEAEIVMDYDIEKLRQILTNLLSNAIKYTPSGGRVLVRLAIDKGQQMSVETLLSLERPATNAVCITVNDSGPGITAQDLPHIFDRFYQANDSVEKAGGTGIGLALTKELVTLLDGSIRAESEEGAGATFIIHIPIRRAAEIRHAHPTPSGQTIRSDATTEQRITDIKELFLSGKLATGENKRNALPQLLIIEDNADVVEYLTSCLDEYYQLHYAYNGQAGIDKALAIIPDIIVSDIMMPEKDGFAVCDELKNDERSSHIPIVFLTAKADIENRLDGLSRGADAYLAKPFFQQELLLTLHNLLEWRRRLQEKYLSQLSIPDTPSLESTVAPTGSTKLEDAFIQKLHKHIEKHLHDPDFGVPHLARKMALSQSQLYRKIKALTGTSTAAYIRRYRLQKSRSLLQQRELTISEIAYEVGFSSLQYFSDAFYEAFGERPSEVANKK